MLRLNIRHQLPRIAIQQQWGKFDSAAAVPAQVSTEDRQARSNLGVTQSSINIDSYPSRRGYGARNMTDFTRERGQKGLSDVRSATSSRTQEGWSRATNAAKRGNDIAQKYKNEMMSKYTARTIVEMNLMPEPNISGNPSQVVGTPDTGDVTAEIQPATSPNVSYTPGSAETYLADEGFIRRWVTEGNYDIYA